MILPLLRSAALRQLLTVALGQGVAALLGMMSLRVFTELAPPAVFGEASLIMGLLAFGVTLCLGPTTEAMMRLYPGHRRDGTGPKLVRVAFGQCLLGASVIGLAGLVWLLTGAFHQPSGNPILLGVLLCAYPLAVAVRHTALAFHNAERHQLRLAAWQVLDALVLLACGAAFLLAHPGIEALVAAYLGAVLLGSTILLGGPTGFLRTLRLGRASDVPAAELRRDLLRFGWPFAVIAALAWIMASFDRFALAGQLDAAAVGVYVAIASVASRIMILPAHVLTIVLRPVLYDAVASGDRPKWRRVATVWGGLSLATAALLLLVLHGIGNQLLGLVLAEEYRQEGHVLLLLIGASFGLFGVAQVAEYAILSRRPSTLLFLGRGLGAAAAIGLAFLAIPALGATGAALSGAGGHLVMLVVCLVLVARRPSPAPPVAGGSAALPVERSPNPGDRGSRAAVG